MADIKFNGWTLDNDTGFILDFDSGTNTAEPSGFTVLDSRAGRTVSTLNSSDPDTILRTSMVSTDISVKVSGGFLNNYELISSDFTIEGFFRRSSTETNSTLICFFESTSGTNVSGGPYIWLNASGQLQINPYNRFTTPSPNFISTDLYNDGRVHHFSLTYSVSQRYYYLRIDGKFIAKIEERVSLSGDPQITKFVLGNPGFANNGTIILDEFRFSRITRYPADETDTDRYVIDPVSYAVYLPTDKIAVDEKIPFIIDTKNVPENESVYWKIVDTATGTTANGKFSVTFGGPIRFPVSAQTGLDSYGYTVTAQPSSAGSYYIQVSTGGQFGPVVARSDTFQVLSAWPANSPPHVGIITPKLVRREGANYGTYIHTTNVPQGTQIYIAVKPLSGGLDVSDFGGREQILRPSPTNPVSSLFGTSSTIFFIGPTASADNLPEGTEEFDIEVRLNSATDPIVATSGTIRLTDGDPLSYSISPSTTSVSEGGSVQFTVTTQSVSDNTTLYWDVGAAPSGASASTSDVNPSSGTVTVNNNTGSFTIQVLTDNVSEQSEGFVVNLRTSSSGTVVATSDIVSITNVSPPSYTVTPSQTTVNEGDTLTVNVFTTNVPDGTTLYFTTAGRPSGPLNSLDFVGGSDPHIGSFTITDNKGSFSLQLAEDNVTEGNETAVIHIRIGSTSGTIVATSTDITVIDSSLDAPTYSIVPQFSEVKEGEVANYTVNTTNVPDGTTLYWSILGNREADLDAMSGSFVVNSNQGTFTITTIADNITEGRESYVIYLRTGSVTGAIVASSPYSIQLLDTSNANPTYDLTLSSVSLDEGDSISVSVSSTNIPNGTVLNWSLDNTSDLTASTGTVTIDNNSGNFTISAIADTTTEGSENFTLTLRDAAGNIVATSPVVTINDTSITIIPPTYSLTSTENNVDEGTSLTLNIATTNVPDGTVLYWTVSDITQFISGAGSTVVFNNAATFDVTPKLDATTEGSTNFTVSLRTNSISGPVVTTSNSIVINDTSTTISYLILTNNSNNDSSEVYPGNTITYTILTGGVSDGTTLYITNYPGTEASSFVDNLNQTTVTIQGDTATFEREVSQNISSQTIAKIHLRTDSYTGVIVAESDLLDILPIPIVYSITANKANVDEGSSIVFTVSATGNVPDGTQIYWSLKGNFNPEDFTGPTSGQAFINSKTAFLPFDLEEDLTIESESFSLEVRELDASGTILATSNIITITDTTVLPVDPTYRLSSNKDSVLEGDSVIITLDTTNVSDGSLVRWIVAGDGINSGDFVGVPSLEGNFNVVANTASVTFTINDDTRTEGVEYFYLTLPDVQDSPIAAVAISDSSREPIGDLAKFYINSNTPVIDEGIYLYFQITATGLTSNVTIPWTLQGIPTQDILGGTNRGSVTLLELQEGLWSGEVQVGILENFKTDGTRTALLTINPGFPYVLEVSQSVIVKDTSLDRDPRYNLLVDKTRVIEGGNVTVTVFATNVPDDTIVPLQILPWEDVEFHPDEADFANIANVKQLYFPALKNNTASYTATVLDDFKFEQTEYFYFNIPGTIASSQVVEIIDSGNTLLTSNATFSGNIEIGFLDKAVLSPEIGGLSIGQSNWEDLSGKLSESIYVQGRIPDANPTAGIFYQPFSYVVRSSISIELWRESIKKVLHPAGLALFSEIDTETQPGEEFNVEPKKDGPAVIQDFFALTADNARLPFCASNVKYTNTRFSVDLKSDFAYYIHKEL